MMRPMRRSLAALLILAAAGAPSAGVDVKVIALFTDKALLQIDGEQKVVRAGESFKGVLLKSASGRGAVVEIDGRSLELGLNQSIAGNFKAPTRSAMKIYPDDLGMYFVTGKINGQTTRFLVDTGATYVTLSSAKARRLNIDYRRDGVPGSAQTAASVVPVWQIKLDSVSIGGILVRDVDATVIEGAAPPEVLLGNSFLRHTRLQQAGSVLEIEKRF